MSQHSNGDDNIDIFYKTALDLTKEAGMVSNIQNKVYSLFFFPQLIKTKTFNRNKIIETKSCDIDFVTETDQAVEKLLIDNLAANFPDHKFIGEESVSAGSQCILTDAPTWIIDPIDGTMNFIHSFPHSCISLALFINQKPEIGIIYNPVLNQLFTARKGKGSFLNDQPIKVSSVTSTTEALIMMEFGTSRDPEKAEIMLENQQILMSEVHG